MQRGCCEKYYRGGKLTTDNIYIAHIREGTSLPEIQTIKEHCDHVAKMASEFGQAFGFQSDTLLHIIGELHDAGKYSARWQQYIRGLVKGKIDHSSAGAQVVEEIYRGDAPALRIPVESCIAGHHAGLLNVGTKRDLSELGASLYGRLNNKVEDYSVYRSFVSLPDHLKPPEKFSVVTEKTSDAGNFSVSFLTRMLFSCLVDADFLDTEQFMNGSKKRKKPPSLDSLSRMFGSYISEHHYLDGKEGINGIRSHILQECMDAGRQDHDSLFTLTVPTGGGKTLSSMAFALEKARCEGKDRIIYVIPYCSIIDQTADVFAGIFGEENILAAYSNADYEGKENIRYASENWDAPIVLTTAVQFFESLYGSRTSKCRKLHNIANTIVIFDEAQSIPLPRLMPCIRAMKELLLNYRTTCVLCTATQPALQSFFLSTFVNGREYPVYPVEICQGKDLVREQLKRVTYRQRGVLTDQDLAKELAENSQALCIVSTKSQAADIFELIQSDHKYHLSTNMTPVHRKVVLKKVRELLDDGLPCILVSTSLIEAGVDVDFPVVYRACAGLDSEIQAAGRCNREGRRSAEESIVHLFDVDADYHLPPSLEAPYEIAHMVTADVADIADYPVIERYYHLLYNATGDGMDIDHTVDAFEKAEYFNYPFADAARSFHLIDSDTFNILIPDDSNEADSICYKLRNDLLLSASDVKFINLHSVSIYENMKKKILPAIEPVDERHFILSDLSLYDKEIGLALRDMATGNAFFA